MKLTRVAAAMLLATVPTIMAWASPARAVEPVPSGNVRVTDVPGILTGSVSRDGRWALVRSGDDTLVADALLNSSVVVGRSVAPQVTPLYPRVHRISADGQQLLELIASATANLSDLAVVNRNTGADRDSSPREFNHRWTATSALIGVSSS